MSKQTASLKSGLTVGTTIHPYDGTEGGAASATGTSIFDPVLCELAYRWFAPVAGQVLDPFAGGSVRGIVASIIGLKYLGIDLRAEQIAANQDQAERICKSPKPKWICGDSKNLEKLLPKDFKADLIFSCPPYADLERYSDNPDDLSTMGYKDFLSTYRAIIAASVARLKPNRFACFVVGDIRDKKGFYRNFPSDTIAAFRDAGMELYNEAILVTAVGSLPIRVGKQFSGARKLGKTHQNVLVFVKGDPRAATADCGDVVVCFPGDMAAEPGGGRVDGRTRTGTETDRASQTRGPGRTPPASAEGAAISSRASSQAEAHESGCEGHLGRTR